MMKTTILVLGLLIAFSFAHVADAQTHIAVKNPERIVLNISEQPVTSMAISWRTAQKVKLAGVWVAESAAWKDFENKAWFVPTEAKLFVTDRRDTVFQYSSLITNLKAGTQYLYRVGGDSVWSEWNSFRTAKITDSVFRFVYFGDPQNDLKKHCSRVFRKAFQVVPDAAFWLFAGDIVTTPEDQLYAEFFEAGSFIFRMIPSALLPGNHDLAYIEKDGQFVLNEKGEKQRSKQVTGLFTEQFCQPRNGLSGFEETSFWFDYQGVRFILLNTNQKSELAKQAPWMDSLLKNNPCRWTVVAFHHPFYSVGKNRDDDRTRNAFQQIFDKYGVDLVLTGHDHAYSRSHKLKNGAKVTGKNKGTVYVVSVSGPKMYELNNKYQHLMAKTGGNIQLFQEIEVNHNVLKFKAFTADGKLYDAFELRK